MTRRLLVMAGGTGGHIFPGAAVAQQLRSEGWQIHWLGTAARMEAQLVPKLGYDISFIDVAGVRGNGLLRLMAAPFQIAKSILQARKVIKQFRPDVVLGMGGFASGPGGIAAWLTGTPLVIHEQNAIAGMTNKILSRFAQRVLLGFRDSYPEKSQKERKARKAQWVGNPVREDIADIGLQVKDNQTATAEDEKAVGSSLNLLVVGGSLGAKCLNDNVPVALANLLLTHQADALKVKHQCGKGHSESVTELYASKVGDQLPWQVSEFIEDMVSAYRWADLIICRAGALTVAEVAAAGRGAIFVPLPHAVDDHQTWNARSLVDEQAGWLLPQWQLEQGKLAEKLKQIFATPGVLQKTAKKARELAKVDATQQVARVCQRLADGDIDGDRDCDDDRDGNSTVNTQQETQSEDREVVKALKQEGA